MDDFVAERENFITALKNSPEADADYHRWQGHVEARRHLAERLAATGSPVARGRSSSGASGAGMTDAKTEIAAFVDRIFTNEAWAESGAEVATEAMRILREAGWRPPLPDVDGPDLDGDDESPVALAASYLAPFIGAPTHRRIDLAVARGLDDLGLLAKPVPDEIAVIAAERRRVVEVEGCTPERDDGYVHSQLVYAAAAYLGETVGAPACLLPGQLWPWAYEGFKPGDALANLVKAGQLIAAEIARLQRTRARAEREQSTSNTAGQETTRG
ncbi:hypothetical protein ACFWMR_02220 [Amycolatopsis thailandensis]|uniref:hypothetical protein n=1 Tax=Amycolatopsis thailandensis TaxID=589330 RepID=UPI0036686489